MDLIEREVTNYMVSDQDSSPESTQSANNIVQAVNNGSVQSNLLQLIQSMGEFLTSDDDAIRAKVTGLLSYTLRNCDLNSLNEPAVSVLVDFYCDRLTDRTCVPKLMEGLTALTECQNFTGVNATTIATRIFERVDVQRFLQPARSATFRVFENLLNRHLRSLRAMNNEFVLGFTQAMDGEKDPRNLMCAFKLIKIIIEQFDISAHVEDIFEVTFCYFPITFKPPPDDPFGITAEDLKQSLRQCLAATAHFAKFAVPLILEKLTSTSGSAKKDSMETLSACAPVYGANAFFPVIDEIFDALKVEVFHSTDPALEDCALLAMQSVIATLSNGAHGATGDPTEKTIKPLVHGCIDNLKEPELKNAKPAGRILRAAASASDAACTSIIHAVVPLLFRQYRETELSTRRKAIMDVMLEFLEAGKSLYGSADGDVDMDSQVDSPLIDYKDRLFAMFESALNSSNEYNGLRMSGLKGLELMVLSRGLLTQNELGIAVHSFNTVLSEETSEELRVAALASLKGVSCIDSKYLVEQTIPTLVNGLPVTDDEHKVIGYPQTLLALQALCPPPDLFKSAMPAILEKFDAVCATVSSSTYPCAILTTLLDIVRTKIAAKHDDVSPCIHTLVPRLFQTAIQAALQPSSSQMILSKDVLETAALLIMAVYENLDAAAQKEFLDRVYALYFNNELSLFDIPSSDAFAPLEESSPAAQKTLTQLLAAVAAACRKEVTFPVESTEGLLDTLTTLALSTGNDIQQTSLVRMIGSIINKWRDASAMSAYVEALATKLESVIESQNDHKSLAIYLWVTKALVLRAHKLGYVLSHKVITWCARPEIGKQASQGFDIMIGEDALALNKAAFATLNILHKQRFFNDSLPLLVEGFRTAQEDVKHNYLIALSYLLKNVPKQILLSELPPLIPLLIQSLSLPDSTLRVSTLETFRLAVTEAPDAMTPHVRAIISTLLGLLDAAGQRNPLEVRIAALKCLAQIPVVLPKDVLQPHMQFVLKQLAKPLDDKKRLVRKEAVDCRAKWYSAAI